MRLSHMHILEFSKLFIEIFCFDTVKLLFVIIDKIGIMNSFIIIHLQSILH
jgi:hypothetical protein